MNMEINEKYIVKEYSKGRSANEIAKELGTYANKIFRILKRQGYETRDKSEAQKNALKKGTASHPTAGRKRTESEKNKISQGRAKAWKEMSDLEREAFSENAKVRWEAMPAHKKLEMQQLAGRALQEASVNGSKAERFLRDKLLKEGYDVVLHKKGLIPGKHEIDLFLPELKVVIEIDGPQHFLPIWGHEKLMDTIKYDEQKNGTLINRGYKVIRVKYLCKNLSRITAKKLWDSVRVAVDNIAGSDAVKDRIMEIELSENS